MEEQRNPYAAPKAPLFADSKAKALPTEADMMEYAGFWRRVGALLLDVLFLAPLGIVTFVAYNYSPLANVYLALPTQLIYLAYYVYLVHRFGGTPGKRVIGMRIAMKDGSSITLQAAFVRYAPTLVLVILSTVASVITAMNLRDAGFEGMNYLEKLQAMATHAPKWNMVVTWVMYGFWIISAIVLVANSRKRAIHDFLAGTVVLREG